MRLEERTDGMRQPVLHAGPKAAGYERSSTKSPAMIGLT